MNKLTFEQQIDILKALNVGVYRTDIHVNEYGIWNEDAGHFENLLDLLNANEIDMLPVIFTNPWREGPVRVGDDWDYYKLIEIINNDDVDVASIKSWDIWESYYDLAYTSGEFFTKR